MMPSRRLIVLAPILAAAAALAVTPAAAAVIAREDLGVNVFGFSHHLKNPWDEDLHEVNPGLGLQWTFARDRRGALDGNLGVYADTFGHANYHLSLGGRVRLVGPVDVGLQMINAVSASLARGEPVLTPYPFLAARLGMVTWNVTYIPEVQSFNAMPAVATFVTVHPWRDRDDEKAGEESAAGAGSALEFTVPSVPALRGLNDGGFMWRRMFDDRRALRLGFRLAGSVATTHMRNAVYGPDGTYSAALLAQYLRRQAPHGRWRTYWATGLEVGFSSSANSSDALQEAWRTDLGAEFALGRGLALAAEYGVSLRYAAYPTHRVEGEIARELDLEGNDVRLLLVAARPSAVAGAEAPGGTGPGDGPVVLVGSSFSLGPFEGAAFAWQWRRSPDAAWRLAVAPEVQNEHDNMVGHERYALGLRGERLHYRHDGGAATYWGLGAVVAIDYSQQTNFSTDPEHYFLDQASRRLRFGGTALVGVEYPLVEGLRALAEYSCDLLLGFQSSNGSYRETSWAVATNPVRLGLAMVF